MFVGMGLIGNDMFLREFVSRERERVSPKSTAPKLIIESTLVLTAHSVRARPQERQLQ